MSSSFHTTRWSVIKATGASNPSVRGAALESLCGTYWSPLYAFLRQRGREPDDAADLVQGLFTKLLAKNGLPDVKPNVGRFRNWLMTSLLNFERDMVARRTAEKRGGAKVLVSLESLAIDPAAGERQYQGLAGDGANPERLFDRSWARDVLTAAMSAVRLDYARRERLEHFETLAPAVMGELDTPGRAAAAERLQLSPVALRVAIHRMRGEVQRAVMATVQETVGDPNETRSELEQLLGALE